ncbi:MAG: ferredoxin [Candidatus Cloacimonadota bacterium]|nr:MAG: ferredoxin [Candidatus Cloacimonadota bacterium]
MKRRNFVSSFIIGLVLPFVLPILQKFHSNPLIRRLLRPPGAKPEKEFLDLCTGCGQCANVCPNQCISLLGFDTGLDQLATPAIVARSRACILCMACTQVCPTGALEKLPMTDEGKKSVNMGKAVLMEDICFSYQGRTCGACYRACPLPGKAMTIGLYEQPTIIDDLCVGCGLCEQACIHMPQAIRVIPRLELEKQKKA